MSAERLPLPHSPKARARIVQAWFVALRDGWAIEVDGLEGVVKAGQHIKFFKEAARAGPYQIHSVEFSDHRQERVAYVALIVRAARKRKLDDFIGGHIETTDPEA